MLKPRQRKKQAVASDLAWVDEFIANVRPYVSVRGEDNLLIRMPNVAHKLNDQGVRVLGFLLDGGGIGELLERVGAGGPAGDGEKRLGAGERRRDILLFLSEVRRCLEGTLREDNHSCAVEVEPLQVNFSRLPVLSEVALTSRCNLSCVFCYADCSCLARAGRRGGGERSLHGRSGGGDDGGDMTTGEVKEVLRHIYEDAQVPSVSFTGGEPTLRDDLLELVAFARELGFRVNLITNGTLIGRKLARRLARAGLHSAQVSLEGTSAAVHDAITGARGSFRKSLAGVGHLHAAGILVHSNTTLNRRNLGDAPLFPRFVRRHLGLERFSMNMIIPAGTAVGSAARPAAGFRDLPLLAGEDLPLPAGTDALLLRYSEMAPVLEEVMAAAEAADVEFMWYSPTPLCIFNPIIHGLGNKGCSACDGLLSVDAAGNVLPCSSFDEPVGNLLVDNFSRIWESDRARRLRRKQLAHDGCHDCDSFAACHGACPLYWRHFGFGELDWCGVERRPAAAAAPGQAAGASGPAGIREAVL